MFKKFSKKFLAFGMTLAIAGIMVVPALVGAAVSVGDQYGLEDTGFQANALGKGDLKAMIAQIINIILGFLGVLAVVLTLAGGFKWMTAGGNEDKVGEARKMIVQGVIGLVIIFAAWAIASFVITQLKSATT